MWCFLFVTKEGSLLHKQIYNMHDLILCVSASEYDSQNTQSHRTTVYVCETLISVVSIGKCCIQVYKTYISRSCRPVYLHDLSLFSVSKFRNSNTLHHHSRVCKLHCRLCPTSVDVELLNNLILLCLSSDYIGSRFGLHQSAACIWSQH